MNATSTPHSKKDTAAMHKKVDPILAEDTGAGPKPPPKDSKGRAFKDSYALEARHLQLLSAQLTVFFLQLNRWLTGSQHGWRGLGRAMSTPSSRHVL